mmetsp:Transcript_14181/g.29801  ORF Transcript_14181/g.29801 Transcript_14181/m.29801 type:complete len:215 (+) Transcript_14181:100-744(+)
MNPSVFVEWNLLKKAFLILINPWRMRLRRFCRLPLMRWLALTQLNRKMLDGQGGNVLHLIHLRHRMNTHIRHMWEALGGRVIGRGRRRCVMPIWQLRDIFAKHKQRWRQLQPLQKPRPKQQLRHSWQNSTRKRLQRIIKRTKRKRRKRRKRRRLMQLKMSNHRRILPPLKNPLSTKMLKNLHSYRTKESLRKSPLIRKILRKPSRKTMTPPTMK